MDITWWVRVVTVVAALAAGCGVQTPGTSDLRQALTLDDVPWCGTDHRSVIVNDCGELAPGVKCSTCQAPEGAPPVVDCAWADDTWCVSSCDACPVLK